MTTAAERLLAWYDVARRELPWRETRDPYAILVSEVMLQQTRVAAVLPRYCAFLERFPTWEALASAETEAVLAAWSGLGYYRRARLLQASARAVVALSSGIPRRAAELAKLPGLGPYTAAAVASIAFGERVPVVDGNVIRVVARLAAIAEPATKASVRRQISAAAASLLSTGRPGDSNQAVMELGATVCTPRAPRCDLCPLVGDCRAHALGSAEAFPVRAPKRSREEHELISGWVEEGGRLLLFRREDEAAWLPGLWELPTVASSEESAAELSARYGGRFELGERLGDYRHQITFRSLCVVVRRARWTSREAVAEGREARWFGPDELEGVATSAMVAKALSVARRRRAGQPAQDG